MSNQPIGYNPGLFVDPIRDGLPVEVQALATSASNSPNLTDSYLGGTIFTGFGQAPAANSSARLRGLNAT